MRVVLAPSVAQEIGRARDWWRANRAAARDLFDDELAHGLRLLGQWPLAVGALVTNARRAGTRRLLLAAIGYLVFYRVESDLVRVLHVRHARRRTRVI